MLAISSPIGQSCAEMKGIQNVISMYECDDHVLHFYFLKSKSDQLFVCFEGSVPFVIRRTQN